MPRYMLIESRDPFESNDVEFSYNLALGLAKAGNEVTVLLVQNGVLAARRGARADGLALLLRAGVPIPPDAFSPAERGISRLTSGIEPAPIDVAVDHLAAGHKTLWH